MSKINNGQSNGRAITVHINNEEHEALYLCKLVSDMKAHHEKCVIGIAKMRDICAVMSICKLRHSVTACKTKKNKQ